MLKKLLAIVGILITVFLLVILIRQADMEKLQAAFRLVPLPVLVMMAIIYLAGMVFRGNRFQLLSSGIKPGITLKESTFPIIIGYTGNNLFPFRMGELVRLFYAHNRLGISKTESAGLIITERFFDLFSILIIFVSIGWMSFSFHWILDTPTYYSLIMGITTVLVILVSGLVGLFIISKTRFFYKWNWVQKLLPVLKKVITLFQTITSIVGSPSRLGLILLSSIGIWLVEAGVYYFAIDAITSHSQSSLPLALFTVGLVNLSVFIPSSPGFLGVFQAMTVVSLAGFGIEYDQSLACGIIIHAVMLIPLTLIGLFIGGHDLVRIFREN
ncbi:MAG: flippase-like domain-containing protein [Bacteroidetes bacterium]|nr:flippase-like domain-containing protein [Bacteroidota bacterium]